MTKSLSPLSFLGVIALLPVAHAWQASVPAGAAQGPRDVVPAAPRTAPFDKLTNNLSEVANLNPEPFSGLAVDSDGKVWAVNPYASTIVCYSGVTPEPELIVPTGANPVSVGIWEPGPAPEDRKVVAVCVGSHSALLHNSQDGSVEKFVKLPSEPADLALDPDNDWAFVTCQGVNMVVQIDLVTFEIIGRYRIGCGERAGPLYLDRGNLGDATDNRVYVASAVTGNNSIPLGPGGNTVGVVFDLDGFEGGELPDEDVFRIDPFARTVDAVVRGAGSLIFKVDRNPNTGALWILSSDSNNKDPNIQTEPLLRGDIAINQLQIVAGVDNSSSLVQAGTGVDLDDFDPATDGAQYDAARSVNQVRTLDFLSDQQGAAVEGFAFAASPMSDVIVTLDRAGDRVLEFNLPAGAQCFDVEVFAPSEDLFLALCLGTMSIEVFSWSPYTATPIASLPLGLDPTPDQVRRGRDVFLDGQRSEDGRATCATCHPRGASDQLGWSLRGTPCDQKDVMVTQSLLSIADSFPHHWRGERDLEDFKKAFRGLLGAPEEEDPTDPEMRDFIAFMQSLQAPANPIGNPRRVLDDELAHRLPTPNGMRGSAINGQGNFQNIPNFNGSTCEGCHQQQSGTDGNYFEEVGSQAPRAAELEVAHLRQLQHKGLDTVLIDFGGPEPRLFNESGYGAAHNGRLATVFNFIFDIPVFFSLNDTQRVNVFKFVQQFDQGLSPASHWSCLFDQASSVGTVADIREILLDGAEKGWNDVAAFGRYDSGSGLEPMRWWYDAGQQLFVPEDAGLASIDWDQMRADTHDGLAENVFVGLPPGNGRRFGVDHDNDGLINGEELALGSDPWNPDSDADGWPDGFEAVNGDDVLTFQLNSGDGTPPALDRAVLDHATARLAKYHVEFSEDVTYLVEYGTPGGPLRTFEREYFSRADTFVVTHSEPSTPTFVPILHDAAITMTDRAGNMTGPLPLASFQPEEASFMLPPFPLNLHVASMEWVKQDRIGGTLDAEVRIDINLNYGAPDFLPAPAEMVFCIVSLHDSVTDTFSQSTTFTTAHETTFDIVGDDEVEEYTADPGAPWIVSPLTDDDGETVIAFRQPGLTAGQTVKVSVMGVVFEGTPPMGHVGTVYESISLFQLQPLLLEDTQELRLDF